MLIFKYAVNLPIFDLAGIIVKQTALLALVSLVGCGTPVISPPQLDKLSGLVRQGDLKTGPSKILSVGNKTLAIVYSVNVPRQLEANKQLISRFDGTDVYYSYAAKGVDVKDDGLIVFFFRETT